MTSRLSIKQLYYICIIIFVNTCNQLCLTSLCDSIFKKKQDDSDCGPHDHHWLYSSRTLTRWGVDNTISRFFKFLNICTPQYVTSEILSQYLFLYAIFKTIAILQFFIFKTTESIRSKSNTIYFSFTVVSLPPIVKSFMQYFYDVIPLLCV